MSDSASSITSTKVKKAKKVEEFKSTAKKVAKVLGLNTTQGILGGVTFALLVIGFLVLFGVFVIKSVTDPNRQLCDREVGTEIGDPFAGPTPQSAPGSMSSGISPTGYSAEGLNGKVTITLNGSSLIAPVRMEIDTTGTLHCNAIYERDAFFCMGYGGAKLRLAQMDFYRTQAQGNLAAIAGSAQISTDVFMRTMNFRKLGQDRYASLTPEARRKLDAQIDGLNEYIKNTPLSDLSPEYSVVLKRKPAFFTGADILTIEALIFTNQDFESSEINRFALLLQNRGVAAAFKYIQSHRSTKKDFVSTLSASDLGIQGLSQAQLDANEARSMDNSGAFDPYRPIPVPPTDDVTASQAEIDAANSPSFQTSSLKRMRLRQKIAAASGTGKMAYTQQPIELSQGQSFFDSDSYVQQQMRKVGEGDHIGNLHSNWFSVSKAISEGSLKSIFANDPHQPLSAPPLEMAVHLRADETGMEVQGLAPLGQYIMNGQNRQMTWGFTTAYTDLGDLFVMVPGPNNTALTPTYVYNGQEKTYVQRREVIAISNPAAPGGFVTVPITVLEAPEYGPVLNTIFGLPAGAPIVAYRSATLRNMDDNATTQSPYEFFTRMYSAGSFDDAKTAASMYTGGGLNIGMTHTNGDIAYLLLSGLPQRKRGHTGMFPVIGNGSWDWKSVQPAAKTIFAVNPSKNYLFSGNSHIVPYGYPGQVGVDHPADTRAGRIDALIKTQLAGDGSVSISDMKAIQQDVMAGIWDNTISGVSMKSILGSADVAALLASSANLPEYEALMAWDGISRIGDQVTVIFEVFIRRIRTLSQGLGLGANAIRDYTIVSLVNSNDAVCTTAPRFVTGNPAFTNCAQFVAAAFDSAVNTIKSKHAGAIPRWSVDGRVGKQVMANPLLSDPTGQSLTATIILPHAGGTQSINVGGNFVESGPWGFMYKTYGSVVRYIAVHDSVSGSQYAQPGGNSGDIRSAHYSDLATKYASGDYISMPWRKYVSEETKFLAPAALTTQNVTIYSDI